ncbi:MAG: hypothetical protein ABIP91_07795 [Sphingomicrobium sp.]
MIAFLPLTATVAATRPSAAIPVAGSTLAAQSDDDDDGAFGVSWPALAVILLTLAVAVWILIDDDGDGDGSLSRG